MSKCANHKICLDGLEKKIERACEERNLKFTDLRREVFLIISKNHGMIKAYDILSQMRKRILLLSHQLFIVPLTF